MVFPKDFPGTEMVGYCFKKIIIFRFDKNLVNQKVTGTMPPPAKMLHMSIPTQR